MRQQSEQLSKAMTEQSRTIKDMTMAAQNVNKQIGQITKSNREHSQIASAQLEAMLEINTIAERNAQGVKSTQKAAANLLERANQLAAIMDRLSD